MDELWKEWGAFGVHPSRALLGRRGNRLVVLGYRQRICPGLAMWVRCLSLGVVCVAAGVGNNSITPTTWGAFKCWGPLGLPLGCSMEGDHPPIIG